MWKDIWRYFVKQRLAVAGLCILLLFIVASIIGPLVISYDPYKNSFSERFQPPSAKHWLGTDWAGRDVLVRLLVGGRISLRISLLALGISATCGGALGVVVGYIEGPVQQILLGINEVVLTFPFLVLAILICAVLGPSLDNAIIAIGISRIPRYIRLMEAAVKAEKNHEYVLAAKAVGMGTIRVLTRHIVPNVFPVFLVNSVLFFGLTLLSEATLSFIGLGAQPPLPSWGLMLREAAKEMLAFPFGVVPPSLALFLVVLSANLIADGLREALDPTLRYKGR